MPVKSPKKVRKKPKLAKLSSFAGAGQKGRLRFIDLFCGIGGFHLALRKAGARCVFASDIDAHAQGVYEINFGMKPVGDIFEIPPSEIPNHDILCAGFPCQPFSQAGFKKGFKDTRGTLFHRIVEILKAKKPKAYFLENVRHIQNHDGGRTFRIIRESLENLNYSFHPHLVWAKDFGLPQHRPRIFMLGILGGGNFVQPKTKPLKLTMGDIIGGRCNKDIGYTLRVGGRGSSITDRRNWDAYKRNGKPYRLKPQDGLALQGFPANFKMPVSETQAMKQLGNSVAVSAIQAYAKQLIKELKQ